MKVNGYKLREALRRWQLRRETAASQFKTSLTAFPGEDKPSPIALAETMHRADVAIAQLQTAQTRYNLQAQAHLPGVGPMPLLALVKSIGACLRLEKLWREAAVVKKDKHIYYSKDPELRDADQIAAVRLVSFEQAAERAAAAAQKLGALREAIAIGNAQELEIEDLSGSLFE